MSLTIAIIFTSRKFGNTGFVLFIAGKKNVLPSTQAVGSTTNPVVSFMGPGRKTTSGTLRLINSWITKSVSHPTFMQ